MGVALMSLHCSWTRIYIKWEGKSEKCSAEKVWKRVRFENFGGKVWRRRRKETTNELYD